MSAEVLAAQQWLNATYGSNPGYIHVSETGLPGTATSFALVSALQIELGISSPTGTFGPATMAASDSSPLSMGSPISNRAKILQHGFWCKGYNPGLVDGDFGAMTLGQLRFIQQDAGLIGGQISDVAYGMQMKAVLGIDEFKLVPGGEPVIRGIQQSLNQRYLAFTGLQPADGVYSRATVTAMIFAIQAEENMPISVANGSFGPSTRSHIPDIPYSMEQTDYYGSYYNSNSIEAFTRIAQWSLYCLGRFDSGPGSLYNPGVPFTGILDLGTTIVLAAFQIHTNLSLRPKIGLDEWMSLLLSTGNPDRSGTACDCATRLDRHLADQLYNAGYRYVGRYLTGDIVDIVNNRRVAKNLLRREMRDIFDAGLRLFLIYQDPREYLTTNHTDSIANYFSYNQGEYDAKTALSVCRSLGVPRYEYIYFTVDYDFTEPEVLQKVIPYFQGIKDYIDSVGNTFRIGIYGARRVCTLVELANLVTSSFVAGLSTGWSGNMGFRLPETWSFDQIKEYPAGVSGVSFPIDKCIASGQYTGFGSFIGSAFDNEWDQISFQGTGLIKVNAWGSNDIPVYWAKIKDSSGNFSLLHPILGDSVKAEAYCSIRDRNPSGDPSSNIRYVYYRDSGGNFNAGYIDTSLGGFEIFTYCSVIRDEANPANSSMVINYPVDPYKHQFILTKNLNYFDGAGAPGPENGGVLLTDTIIEVSPYAVSGQTNPDYIQVHNYIPVGSTSLEGLIPGQSYGFVQLDFETGVLPSDRTPVSEIV